MNQTINYLAKILNYFADQFKFYLSPFFKIRPFFSCDNKDDFNFAVKYYKKLFLRNEIYSRSPKFFLIGFCIPCIKFSRFLVDLHFGGRKFNNKFFPNWRERVLCSKCN